MTLTREDIFNSVQITIKEKDMFAANEYLLRLGDDACVAEAYGKLVLDCYHKAKSIAQVMYFAHAGIHYCQAAAVTHEKDDAATAKQLRSTAKRIATNAASFTWPGWDNHGITITPDQMRQGLVFARYSVRLLLELEPSIDQQAFTYWFLGAQLLANRYYDEARHTFEQAKEYSRQQDNNLDGVTMLEGYIGLTAALDGQKEVGEHMFQTAVNALKARGNEDATFYATQLQTARTVFESR
jgi:hypothetical protein